MLEEMDAMEKNKTWTLTELPRGVKAIKCKWIFKSKFNADGELVKHKARLVARGFTQRYGIDYVETYSPVARYTSIRCLIAIAARRDMEIYQMDAVTAFLQGKLTETIYMEQPEGFSDGTNKVCRLNRSIYGLKQAGRVWNKSLDNMLQSFGLTRSLNDSCIYVSPTADLIIAIYVDDFLILYDNVDSLNALRAALCDSFHMKDLGKASSILGMKITYDENHISLDQSIYIREVLEKFGMSEAKPTKTPAVVTKSTDEDNDAEQPNVPYREAVGSLIYLAQATRPDIAYAVNKAAQNNSNFRESDWISVKRIFRYLVSTSHYKLNFFRRSQENQLIGYCDSDYASDSDRKSQSGIIFMMSEGAICWNSTKQKIIALSSTEAEFIALTQALQEAQWLRMLLDELHFNIGTPQILCDNTSTIKIATNNNYSARTKHIDVRIKFLIQQITDHAILLNYVNTNDNIADFLTKPLCADKHERFAKAANIN